jgi:hypothetical protein
LIIVLLGEWIWKRVILLLLGVLILPSQPWVESGIIPPPPPSPTRSTSSQTPTTSDNGTISSMTSNTIHTYIVKNMSVTPLTYGMLGFDSISTLTYSTLQTVFLGAGSYIYPLQGSLGGTYAMYNVVPYGGGDIHPPSPSIRASFQ